MAEPAKGDGGFLSGLLTGALIGAGAAMLLVPQSGEESRDLVRAKSREASNLARDTFGDLYATGRDLLDRARAAIDDAVAEGQSTARAERQHLEEELAAQRESERTESVG